jgi:hypothetical protein
VEAWFGESVTGILLGVVIAIPLIFAYVLTLYLQDQGDTGR